MSGRTLPEHPPAARLLDLTRLFSRVGFGAPTGVDRVEAAYLAALSKDPVPLFGIIRTPEGYALLDRDGINAVEQKMRGQRSWGAPDLRARLRRKASPVQRAARADLRRIALATTRAGHLRDTMRKALPPDTAWLNVGHSNLDAAMFDAVHALPGGRASVLIHDTIPLDHPQFQTPRSVERFTRKLENTAKLADLVICNSRVTEADATRHFRRFGRVPPTLVAHLGVHPAPASPSALREGLDPARPWFLVLGTIEPRKNHALLLDIWDHFSQTLPPEEIPRLVIAGRRGWENHAVFEWLDSSPLNGTHIIEFSDLDDRAVSALMSGARALLMPSHAEGFGLPPAEAIALGTPAIVNDLPVYREVLGNNPVYVPVTDRYSWAQQILDLARAERIGSGAADRGSIGLPTWQEHFNLVLKVT